MTKRKKESTSLEACESCAWKASIQVGAPCVKCDGKSFWKDVGSASVGERS